MDIGIGALVDELPSDLVITDPDITASYARDQSRFTSWSVPAVVLAPRSTAEASLCLTAAHRHSVPVVIRGAGSGLSGGANGASGAVMVSTHRLKTIVDIDAEARLATVQAGVVTADLRAAAGAVGLHYPPDPGSVEMCTIGGNIATNAGGMCCVKYGVTRDYVAALTVVLADGTIMRTGHTTRKGVVGYDTTGLIVGSEGSLCMVAEATVRLVPAPAPPTTVLATFDALVAAGRAIVGVHRSGTPFSMVEILDGTTVRAVEHHTGMDLAGVNALLLIQYEGNMPQSAQDELAAILSASGATDVVTSSDPQESDMLLQTRRMALPALEGLGDWLLDDVCVPVPRIVELIAAIEHIADRRGLTIGVFGHAGDGNLHPTIIFDASDAEAAGAAHAAFVDITDAALALGGTASGEHGVGRLKRPWLIRELDPADLALQRRLRAAFDPEGMLSPAG
ncbi:FAD-binding protein [Gordonia polyisoprenivorans]|uniref:FAD-binding protein n=3 Tax=Mycobacteriales TaxID=85007 RepID=A0A846WVM0_9ACTN|nr:FAD-binding protein [Gordonia polyisoprenivorans]NKY20968.1 FAD-binding protein [Tsukamurella spumae]NMD58390.1 FAD-binding protein [Tsukamurella columbiensis]QUD85871.1 FAD-binding protein [Gordonia polyisoprenivorans]